MTKSVPTSGERLVFLRAKESALWSVDLWDPDWGREWAQLWERALENRWEWVLGHLGVRLWASWSVEGQVLLLETAMVVAFLLRLVCPSVIASEAYFLANDVRRTA